MSGDDLARAAVDRRQELAQALPGDPQLVMSRSELVGTLDAEEPVPSASIEPATRWISRRSRITPSTGLRFTGRFEPSPCTGDIRSHQPDKRALLRRSCA
jgi:hypothetical protein